MDDLSKELNKELSKDFAYCEDALGRAEGAIGNLPSVQPEKRTEERTETHSCDLIDREAAVDAICHHFPSVSRTRARTMLHEVPSLQPEQKWIPCSERLPEKDGRYQVTRYDYVANTEFIDILWYEENLWWNRHSTGDYAVTAWMPLPEPYKEEQE